MKTADVFPAWGRILRGYRPFLSIEITKECPLRCPGCYAYQPDHVGEDLGLRQLSDLRGDQLTAAVLALVRRLRPLHLSIVGGEPLVRYRELDKLLPQLDRMGVEVQVVTSAVRAIPAGWSRLRNVHMVVSVDGLAPEHDRRRTPATYARIIPNMAGHRAIIHCTVTAPMVRRPGYLAEFARFWSGREEARKIWFSLYTPQDGDASEERLTAGDRAAALKEIAAVRRAFPKVHMPDAVLEGYRRPPKSPEECVFAQVTTCVSADLESRVTPCQFGGRPVCEECGCMASAGLASVARHRLAGLVPLGDIFKASRSIGDRLAAKRAA